MIDSNRRKMGREAMADDADDLLPTRKKLTELTLGGDLSAMSEHELMARIAALETEIVRCRDAIAARQSTKSAAESFFRKT
jgi:uncharacterized small protein (DUF1192 family)